MMEKDYGRDYSGLLEMNCEQLVMIDATPVTSDRLTSLSNECTSIAVLGCCFKTECQHSGAVYGRVTLGAYLMCLPRQP